jgi:uncharacterized delta-60 repeat protein
MSSFNLIIKFLASVKKGFSLFIVIVSLVAVVFQNKAQAQAAGDVDLSFNAGTFTNFTGSGLNIKDIEIQADGKIIIGGVFEKINGVTNWSIARLNPDGSLDMSFQSPFIYTVTQTQVSDLILLPDGKILVNGFLITPSGTKRIVRLNPNGTIDPTFSADPAVGGGSDFSLLPSGAILVTNGSNTVSVLNGNDGSLISSAVMNPTPTFVRGLAVLSEFQFLLADYDNNFGFIRRYFTDGQWDNSVHVLVANNRIDDIRLQPDGRVLISGAFTQVDSLPKSGVVRLNPDNFVDMSFNTSISIGDISATKTQPDGKIILVGRFFFNGDSTPYLTARLNPDGSLDSSFTRIVSGPNSNSPLITVNLQPDGKTLIGGDFLDIGGVPRQLIARLLALGTSNEPPVLSNVTVTSPINENDVATLTGDIADANAGDSFMLTVDWGDGSAPQNFNFLPGTASFSLMHQYSDDNPSGTPWDNYTINLSLSDSNGGNTTDSTALTVNNLPPALSSITVNPGTINAGGTTTLSGNISDVGTFDTHQIVINWGDGSPNTTLNLPPGATAFNANHQYNNSGVFNIAITATDDDTGSTNAGAMVTVNSPPPAAPTNLTATPVSPNQINLQWIDNSNNETGFIIERCDRSNKCVNFVQIVQTGENVTTFANTGLTAATNYTYRVRAFNANGNSAYSNTAKAKTPRR